MIVVVLVVCVAENKQRKKSNSTSEMEETPVRPESLATLEVRSTAITLTWTQPQPPACCPVVAYRILTRNLNSECQHVITRT